MVICFSCGFTNYCVFVNTAQFDGGVLPNVVLSALQEDVFFAGLDQLLE